MDTIVDTIDEVVGNIIPAFVSRLSSYQIVPGVSLFSFIIALVLTIIVTGAILYRA